MKISIFLSYPQPIMQIQKEFIEKLTNYLEQRGFSPRTLGVTDYDMDAPLKTIRRLMLESNGLITVAFRRTYIKNGTANFDTDINEITPWAIDGYWLTSPWAQIEPAMAYQLGLPVLILREKGVLIEGLLDKGVLGLYMPQFNIKDSISIDAYFSSPEWNGMIGKWEGYVRQVVEQKGNPPRLFG